MDTIVMPNGIMADFIGDIIGEGKTVRLKVQGNSMFPFLRNEKDVVEIWKVDRLMVKRGDIVLFKYSGGFILHRIVNRIGNVVITQGDGICVLCETIDIDDIIGIARNVIRENGKVVRLDSTGRIVLVNLWMGMKPLRKYLLYVLHRWL